MPVVIFHGDNYSVLNQRISEMKKSYPGEAIERVSLKEETFEQLLMRLATPSFFVEQRLIIVEDVEEKKIEAEKIVVDNLSTLVLVFGKELTASSAVLKWGEKNHYRIISFSQPQDKRIFTFLDLVADKNNKALGMVEELVTDFGVVYLLTMLLFLLRRLQLPIGKVPAFVEEKMKKQKKNFSQTKLVELYKKTLELDYAIKTGRGEEKTGLLLLLNSFLEK